MFSDFPIIFVFFILVWSSSVGKTLATGLVRSSVSSLAVQPNDPHSIWKSFVAACSATCSSTSSVSLATSSRSTSRSYSSYLSSQLKPSVTQEKERRRNMMVMVSVVGIMSKVLCLIPIPKYVSKVYDPVSKVFCEIFL